MMKRLVLLAILIYIIVLGGCNKQVSEREDSDINIDIPSSSETTDNPQDKYIHEDEIVNIATPDLTSEEGIRDYLLGEWVFEKEYTSDVICNMFIDKDLNLELSFENLYGREYPEVYSGKIILDRQYASLDEAPDLISFELDNDYYPGGDYFFLHRTNYDEKDVMSLFFAGNGNCIFDLLGPVDYQYAPDEIMFEKVSDQVSSELSNLLPRKNDQFYAVFWGMGEDEESLWLDDVQWLGRPEYDFEAAYPRAMTTYENDLAISILYDIVPKQRGDILGDDLFPGQVYYVETDENASIKDFIDAERKEFLEESNELEDYGYALFQNTDIGRKKVVKSEKDIELSGSSGPFTVKIKDIEILDLNLFDEYKEDFDNKDKLTVVTMALEIEHNSTDLNRIYPELSFLVTNTNERAEIEYMLSDSFGGEFSGEGISQGNLVFILGSQAENIEKITYIIEGPQDKNYNSLSQDIEFKIEF